MAGVKGRSGGPRKNSGGPRANSGGPRRNAGGYRHGAGRRPDPPVLVDDPSLDTVDPDEWLKAAMNSEAVPTEFRVKAASYLRQRPIAPLEVADALYMKAMGGSVTAQITYLKPYLSRPRGRRK